MVNVTTSYSPKIISFEDSLDLCFADSRIFYFWQVLKFIHKFIIELHVLQCLFVRGDNKKQKRVRLISNFAKRETFHLLWQLRALGKNLTMWPSFLHPSKMAFLSPSVWPSREYTWTLNWKDNFLNYFQNCQDVPFSHE